MGFLPAGRYGTLNGMSRSRLLQDRYPKRATQWRLRSRTLEFGRHPLVMGIVNVTPDSFSDGGQFANHEDAIEHALQLAAEGADILDIGGESTRPDSEVVAVDEELQRVIPVVEALAKRTRVPISIDTSKAIVAKAAVFAGAEIINDVTGLAGDPAMIEVAVESSAGVCAMHMQGTPQTMQDNPRYDDVVADIKRYLGRRRDVLQTAGIELERICLDPGVGFGKTHQHNLTLMANSDRFTSWAVPCWWGTLARRFWGSCWATNRPTAPQRRWAGRSAWRLRGSK